MTQEWTTPEPIVPDAEFAGSAVELSSEARLVLARANRDGSLTEDDLHRRIQELEDFVENAAEGVHSVAEDGTILWANRAELELLGYSRDEYFGHHIAEFHADREVIDDMLARLGRNETLRGYEARMRCKDGSIRYVLVNSNVLWREGKFVHTRCFTRDITARKRSQDALLRLFEITSSLSSAQTPEQVAEVIIGQGLASAGAVAGSAYLLDAEGRTLTLLRAAGYRPEVLERFEAIPLEAALPLAHVVRTGAPLFLSSQQAYEMYEGVSSVPLDARSPSIAALPLALGGRSIGALGFSFAELRDFDEDARTFLMALAHQCAQALERARLFVGERDARNAAESAERRSAFLAEASSVLGSSLDSEAMLARVADFAVPRVADWCIVELAEDERATESSLAVAHVDSARVERVREYRRRFPLDPELQAGVAHVMRTGTSELHAGITDEQLAARGLPTEQIAMLRDLGVTSSMVVPMAARGRVLGAIVLVCGVSGRRFTATDLSMAEELGRRAAIAVDNARLYREAQKAVHAREDLLAVVSHDLRSPLGLVMMNAAMLLHDKADRDVEKGKRGAERVIQAARRMERLIQDLLDFASIESGHLSVERQAESVRGLMADTIESLRPSVEPRQFHLVDKMPPGVDALVSCDRGRVLQILSNLIGNAVKATPETGSIALEIGPADGAVTVSVRDSGSGIEPTALARIFDRYWTGRPGRPGLGLGLYITKGLVAAHGGRVWAESTVGLGSTFHFTLPLVASDAKGAQGPRSKSVLVIDDDEALTAELTELLTENGYEVQVFSNGKDALVRLDTGVAPSLILLDLMMPEMDGWECFTALKTNPALRHTPVVIMSSVVGDHLPILGAAAYLRKPFRAEQIVDVAARYTGHYASGVSPSL